MAVFGLTSEWRINSNRSPSRRCGVSTGQNCSSAARTFERVLLAHHGRPHWAKAHTATAETLAPRYPRWETFQRVRQGLDPDGRFTNAYLARVLGPVGAPVPVPDGR